MEYQGRVKNGVIVLEGASLPEGLTVRVVTTDAQTKLGPRRSLAELAGKAKNLPADASANHDHYLYGAPKE